MAFYVGTKIKKDKIVNQVGTYDSLDEAIEICDKTAEERNFTFRVFDENKEIKYTSKYYGITYNPDTMKVHEVEDNVTEEAASQETVAEDTTEEKPQYVDVDVSPYTIQATSTNVRLRNAPEISKDTETGRVAGSHIYLVVAERRDISTSEVLWVQTAMKDWICAKYTKRV